MNPGAGQFILHQLVEGRAIEEMAFEFGLDRCIGFCKEWGKKVRGRGNNGTNDRQECA